MTTETQSNAEWAFRFILEMSELTPDELSANAQDYISRAKHIATVLSTAKACFAYVHKVPAGYHPVILESMRCESYGLGTHFETKADAKKAIKAQFPNAQIITEKAVDEERARRQAAFKAKHGFNSYYSHRSRLDEVQL